MSSKDDELIYYFGEYSGKLERRHWTRKVIGLLIMSGPLAAGATTAVLGEYVFSDPEVFKRGATVGILGLAWFLFWFGPDVPLGYERPLNLW